MLVAPEQDIDLLRLQQAFVAFAQLTCAASVTWGHFGGNFGIEVSAISPHIPRQATAASVAVERPPAGRVWIHLSTAVA